MSSVRPAFVTVVTGVPRSGTSLVMQMLAAGGMEILSDGVRAPDEDNPRGYLEYEPAKALARDASWLGEAEGRALKVVHSLAPLLPPGRDYRVVLVRRDLREVVASQQRMLERLGKTPEPLPAERLMAVYGAGLDDVERWARERQGVELLPVAYADIVGDPGRAAGALARFLGGELVAAAMAAAVDPLLHRQRANA